jgi:DNA-binding IclR family transcriptional regulator
MSALRNGFQILDLVVAAGNEGLPFARIVERTHLPKASVHRLLKELVEVSALTFEPGTRRYRGGLRLARLGAHLLARGTARRRAERIEWRWSGHRDTVVRASSDDLSP